MRCCRHVLFVLAAVEKEGLVRTSNPIFLAAMVVMLLLLPSRDAEPCSITWANQSLVL